jgi:hypothetical protein
VGAQIEVTYEIWNDNPPQAKTWGGI